jgi:hypothetical protein
MLGPGFNLNSPRLALPTLSDMIYILHMTNLLKFCK